MHLTLVRLMRKLHLNAPQVVGRHGTKATLQGSLTISLSGLYTAARSPGQHMWPELHAILQHTFGSLAIPTGTVGITVRIDCGA